MNIAHSVKIIGAKFVLDSLKQLVGKLPTNYKDLCVLFDKELTKNCQLLCQWEHLDLASHLTKYYQFSFITLENFFVKLCIMKLEFINGLIAMLVSQSLFCDYCCHENYQQPNFRTKRPTSMTSIL